MAKSDVVEALLDRHGTTYAEELGIGLDDPGPAALFQWLCASMLMSARIDSRVALQAARNLFDRGWTTPEKMQQSTWEERVEALNEAGYARYQERTADMLGEVADHAVERWKGDLRRLRDEAERDPDTERQLLKEFKGLGDVGVDIFFREVQAAWDELRPFADDRALGGARRLDLADDAEGLEELAGGDFPQLVAACVRVDLEEDEDEIRRAAGS